MSDLFVNVYLQMFIILSARCLVGYTIWYIPSIMFDMLLQQVLLLSSLLYWLSFVFEEQRG